LTTRTAGATWPTITTRTTVAARSTRIDHQLQL
jgi:hypothetical protein